MSTESESEVWICCQCRRFFGSTAVYLACANCGHERDASCSKEIVNPHVAHEEESAQGASYKRSDGINGREELQNDQFNERVGSSTSEGHPETEQSSDDLFDSYIHNYEDKFGDEIVASGAGPVSGSVVSPNLTLAGSGHSPEYITSTEDNFVQFFTQQTELERICKAAVRHVNIGAERFADTFERLLRIYGRELSEEAHKVQQVKAASFIGYHSAVIARRVKYHFDLDSLPSRSNAPGTEDGNKFEVLHGLRGTSWEPDLGEFKDLEPFLRHGRPYENLLARIRDYVNAAHGAEDAIPEPPITDDGGMVHVVIGIAGRWFGRFRTSLYDAGLLRPKLRPGYQRIAWKCQCGATGFDDYKELKPGALKELPRQSHILSHAVAPSQILRQITGALSNSVSNVFHNLRLPFGIRRARPASNPGTLPTANATPLNTANPQTASREVYLLICVGEGDCGVRLEHEPITSISCDLDLFRTFKHAYKKHRSRTSWLTFRTLSAIKLTKFIVDMSKRASVKAHEQHCISSCGCLPPPDKIEPSPGAEYRCSPAVPDRTPPIGPTELIHYVQNPEHVLPTQRKNYNQIPKRIAGELIDTQDTGVAGWGVHFEEGRDVRSFWILFVTIFVLGSALFGVLWAVLEHDLQTAFTVSAWVTMTGEMFLACLFIKNANP